MNFSKEQWALILGGSSGMGLASAKKLAKSGMSVCLVHRDRRKAMVSLEKDFEEIKSFGNGFVSFNLDALTSEGRNEVCEGLKEVMVSGSSVHVLLHSIAFGNLKIAAPLIKDDPDSNTFWQLWASKLRVNEEDLKNSCSEMFADPKLGGALFTLNKAEYGERLLDEEDMAHTIYSMGTSILTWTQALYSRGMFGESSRVIGLTSEGNSVAWRGYGAVSAAKCALESVARTMALEFAPHGVRTNVIQAGITPTPALKAIPGHQQMLAYAALRNPFKRLTQAEDVANAVALLCTEEAAWINGALLRVDGGEHIGSI